MLFLTADEPLVLGDYTAIVSGVTDTAGNVMTPFSISFSVSPPGDNLSRVTEVTFDVSSSFSSFGPERIVDGDLNTSWFTASGDAVNQGTTPFLEIILPGDAAVNELRMFGNREFANGFDFFAGIFQLFDNNGIELFNSGEVDLPAPDRDAIVPIPDISGTRRVRFTATADESADPGFAELEVIGQFTDPALAVGVLDNNRPQIVSVTPVNSATDVPADTEIVVTFDEVIDPITVNSNSLPITISGVSGVIAGDYTVDGAVVSFTPADALPGESRINVQVNSNVRDLANNASLSFFSFFNTGTAAVDDILPEVVMVTPSDGASEIGPNAAVVLTFSESLNASTVNGNNLSLFADGQRLSPSVSRSSDNRTVTLRVTLPADSLIEVVVTSDVEDLAGNALVDFSSAFTTAASFDVGRPRVVTQRPGNGASGVSVDASVVLYVDEPLEGSTAVQAFNISQDGVLVSGEKHLSADGRILTFTPDQPWSNEARIQVFLTDQAQDRAGNALFNYQGSFRTEADTSLTQPRTVRTSPIASFVSDIVLNPVIEVEFNEPLDVATVDSSSVMMFASGSGNPEIPRTVSLVRGDRVIRIVPDALLDSNTTYFYDVSSAVNDLDGQSVAFFRRFFTTGESEDTINPMVEAVSPPEGSTGVGVNAEIRVRFDEAINPLTVTEQTLSVSDGSSTAVACSFSFSNGNQEVVMVPHTPLTEGASYSLTIDGIEDVAGNAVVAQTTQFETSATLDTQAPQIVATVARYRSVARRMCRSIR